MNTLKWHTPEPWSVCGKPTGHEIRTANSERAFIASVPDGNNAQRIVACVNAYASIPDPASAVPALVGALEKLLPLAESGRVHHGKFEDTQPIMDQARAALALAQGGKR